jgi:hypothetical protein
MNKFWNAVAWIIMVILFMFGAYNVYSAERGAPTGDNMAKAVFPAELYVTLLDASPAASTGLSAVEDLGMTPRETKCMISITGTTPTSWTAAFYSGPSSTNMTTQYPVGATQSDTFSSFPIAKNFLNGYGDRYWKVNNVSTVGGDATTKYTVQCTGIK